MLEYDDIIDAPSRAAHVRLTRAEAFTLAEVYLGVQLEALVRHGSTSLDNRVGRLLDELIAKCLINPEEVDHIAERLLGARGAGGGGRLAGLDPDASQRPGPGGLRFVRRRLRREGVPGADWRCLYTIYAEAWSRGTIEVGTLPKDEKAYRTVKELMSEGPAGGPSDGPLMESDIPF